MLDCLKGYIGLSSSFDEPTTSSSSESCSASSSHSGSKPVESGLYVDELPDISVAFIGKLVQDEKGVKALWKEIENRAILKFRTFFIQEVNKCHKVSDVTRCECLMCENRALLATSLWYLLGAELMFERASSNRVNGYTSLDRQKAKEMRDNFLSEFERELHVAVNGIDVRNSLCFAFEEVEDNNVIITAKPIL